MKNKKVLFDPGFKLALLALLLTPIQKRPACRPLPHTQRAQILLELGAPVRPRTLTTMAAPGNLSPLTCNARTRLLLDHSEV